MADCPATWATAHRLIKDGLPDAATWVSFVVEESSIR
jgi:hypothetical protein